MRKDIGQYFIERYDELGNKEDTIKGDSVIDCLKKSDEYCKKEGHSTVTFRIIDNSKQRVYKYT